MTAFDPLLPVSRTAISVGAGAPAKNQTRRLAPAAPVFAGTPAPTECAWHSRHQFFQCPLHALRKSVNPN
ncbi:hypothetical protein F7661_20510 [Pseudomonas sp. CFA]|nr:hypothetical protein F7661_20510 [Pseudomonas sp. CFA]